jgi:hypothetical protein
MRNGISFVFPIEGPSGSPAPKTAGTQRAQPAKIAIPMRDKWF